MAAESLRHQSGLGPGRSIGDLEAERDELGARLRREQPARTGPELDSHRRWLVEAETELAAAVERRDRAATALAVEARWHRRERAALGQRVEAESAAITGWSAQVGLRRDRLAPIERADADWTAWTTARAGDIERYARLGEAVDRRREALSTAAAVESPRWLTDTLGPEPAGWYERSAWRSAVSEVVTWRERFGVTDPDRIFGAERVEPRLANLLEVTARRLEHPLAPELQRDLGLDPGYGLEL